jgi:hypothetical protein
MSDTLKTATEAAQSHPEAQQSKWQQARETSQAEWKEEDAAEALARQRGIDYSEARRIQAGQKLARTLAPTRMTKITERENKTRT